MNPYIFNFSNGVLFVILGLWSHSMDWKYSIYFAILGMVLIALTYFVKNSNKLLGSAAMISTLLATIVLAIIFFTMKDNSAEFASPVAMMTTSAFITSLAFVQCAANHKEEGECCVLAADGSQCCDKRQTKEQKSKTTSCC